jgi:hypothetical protein
MSYIGNIPTTAAFVTDTFNGNGSLTAFTMSAAPATTTSILVSVSGVLQDPSTYSVSGTTLTFSAAPPAGTGNISVRFLGIPASGVVTTAYRTQTEFTATAGQTTFSVPSYTVGFIDVYRNGALLGSADFTATNGTTVVLAAGASAGDLIETISFYVSSVLNAIPATAGAVTNSYIFDGAVTNSKITSMDGSKLTGTQVIPKATLPTGSVLQVVTATDTTERSTSSTSFVTASNSLSVTLTPISSSSKVFIVVTTVTYKNTDNFAYYTIYRNSTNLGDTNGGMITISPDRYVPTAMSHLDSPNTTSSITYQVYFRFGGGSGACYLNARSGGVGQVCSITAFEIAG